MKSTWKVAVKKIIRKITKPKPKVFGDGSGRPTEPDMLPGVRRADPADRAEELRRRAEVNAEGDRLREEIWHELTGGRRHHGLDVPGDWLDPARNRRKYHWGGW